MREDAAGVREAARQVDALGRLLEALHRLPDSLRRLRGREMGHEGDRARRRRATQPLERRLHGWRQEAQPVHPGIDLEVRVDRARRLLELEHPQLLVAVDGASEPGGGGKPQVLGVEETLQQQDRLVGVFLPQHESALDLESREAVGSGEGRGDAPEPMPVGIRLDHGEDLRAWRGQLGHAVVVAQRGCGDGSLDRAGHAQF
jgi:hypothetical protein